MQQTIKKEVGYKGIGLHSGKEVELLFKPAPPNTGIVFVRVDKEVQIPAQIENVRGSDREITLEKDGVQIRTVEHILAALAGLEIDNAYVELNQDEPPVGDGSALTFAQMLLEAGTISSDFPKRKIPLDEPIWFKEEDKSILITPTKGLWITCTIDFEHPVIGKQSTTFLLTPEIFMEEIAPARTFGFLSEVEPLREKGFFKGGNLENAIILDEEQILNDDLRFKDELIRHKILDLIGDLSLLGGEIQGHILAIKSGHTLNIKFADSIKRSLKKKPVGTPFFVPKGILNIDTIQEILPHRYPFLLVDRIIEMEEGHKIVGLKNVSINEPFFKGHFPDRPIMPGVLIIEAMAQVGGVLMLSQPENRGKLIYFAGIEEAKFRRPVIPGDQLRIEAIPIRIRQRVGKMQGIAYVGNELVAKAQMTFSLSGE